jgi:hypothetical protein
MPHCLAGFITVAAIMPEAMGGGKPRADRAARERSKFEAVRKYARCR